MRPFNHEEVPRPFGNAHHPGKELDESGPNRCSQERVNISSDFLDNLILR